MDRNVFTVVKYFDSTNFNWEPNLDANMLFVITVLRYCEKEFESRGYLMLNDVYEKLGLPKTRQGYVAGWVYDYKPEAMWSVFQLNSTDIGIRFRPVTDVFDILPKGVLIDE